MSALQLTIIKYKDSINYDEVVQRLSAILKSTSGVESIYSGHALDAPKTAVLAVIWNSFKASLDFVKSQVYADFLEVLESNTIERPKTTHCLIEEYRHDLKAVFDSPAIEFAPLTLKGDKLWQHYKNFETAGKIIAAAKGNIAQFQQPQIEAPYTQWSLVSWESIEAHENFNKAPEFSGFLEYVAPNVDMPGPPPIIHVKFKPVFGSL